MEPFLHNIPRKTGNYNHCHIFNAYILQFVWIKKYIKNRGGQNPPDKNRIQNTICSNNLFFVLVAREVHRSENNTTRLECRRQINRRDSFSITGRICTILQLFAGRIKFVYHISHFQCLFQKHLSDKGQIILTNIFCQVFSHPLP